MPSDTFFLILLRARDAPEALAIFYSSIISSGTALRDVALYGYERSCECVVRAQAAHGDGACHGKFLSLLDVSQIVELRDVNHLQLKTEKSVREFFPAQRR